MVYALRNITWTILRIKKEKNTNQNFEVCALKNITWKILRIKKEKNTNLNFKVCVLRNITCIVHVRIKKEKNTNLNLVFNYRILFFNIVIKIMK